MIEDRELLERWERELLTSDRTSLEKKFHILDAMWEEAILLRALPPSQPLEGIDVDLRIARVINSVQGAPGQNGAPA
ncbi:MAG: hypothetical protein H5T72_07595 [Actinobacteria bacterium]|nr:hypothetical protein [Actinomycetota bacterium]